jgi:hypothetical protein
MKGQKTELKDKSKRQDEGREEEREEGSYAPVGKGAPDVVAPTGVVGEPSLPCPRLFA